MSGTDPEKPASASESSLYKLTVDLQVLKHLGIGLYSNLPSVISEMVANAYDADAAEVTITITKDSIVIKDDGLGMDVEAANNKFLKVGYDKRSEKQSDVEFLITPLFHRLPMGRKGIGKLSAFAIADVVKVESVKTDPVTKAILGKAAFSMDVIEITKRAIKKEPYHPDPKPVEEIDFEKGTRITLTSLKRKRLVDSDFVIRNLARRFVVLGQGFQVKVDDHVVSSADRQYWNNLQFVWGLGEGSEFEAAKKGSKVKNAVAIAGSEGDNPEVLSNVVNVSITESPNVSGWIGTVHLPKDLKDNNIDNNGIVIMARGKLVHENILPFARNTRIFTEYIVGEIYADWLDTDDDDDIATSNRQSLNETDERFIALQAFVKTRLMEIAELWDKWRKAVGTKTAIERHPALQEWLDTLLPDNKKKAEKLIASIEGMPISDDDSKKELFQHGIMAFETLALKGTLETLDRYTTINADEFRGILRAMGDLDAAHYFQVAKGRWAVLGQFEKLVDDNAKEKLIQEEIYGHTWLLDSSWERPTEDQRMEKRFVDALKAEKLGIDKNDALARYDIKFLTVSGIDLVVELKRSGRTVTFGELMTQVGKYNGILKAMRTTDQSNRDFEIVVVVGKFPKGFDEAQRGSFKAMNARLFTYESLISHARASYKDFLETQKNVTKIQQIVDRL
ncbi:MAG: ATP-binding protein [Pyrinomonadaceae bacterium]